jgi:hypothetical protein
MCTRQCGSCSWPHISVCTPSPIHRFWRQNAWESSTSPCSPTSIAYCCIHYSPLCASLTREQLLQLARCNEALRRSKSGSGSRATLPAFHRTLLFLRGTRSRSWLTHCPTTRKVAVSFPDGVTGNFHWLRLRGLRVRISPGAWMFLVGVACCDVEVSASADREASILKRYWPTTDCWAMEKNNPSDRTVSLGSTQSLTEISTRDVS